MSFGDGLGQMASNMSLEIPLEQDFYPLLVRLIRHVIN